VRAIRESPLKWTERIGQSTFSGLGLGSLGIDPQVVMSGDRKDNMEILNPELRLSTLNSQLLNPNLENSPGSWFVAVEIL
jgi:hypothetical protein